MADSSSPFAGALLLCIDLQPVFLNAIADRERILRRSRFAIAAAKGLNLPIVFTEQVPQKLGETDPTLLALVDKPVQLGKTTFSALADDGIREALQARNAEHLIICGIETPICVYQTALDAIDLDFPVTLLSDAIGGRRPEDASVCLSALTTNGVHFLPSETVFYALLHGTKHPFFKAFTQLVKAHA